MEEEIKNQEKAEKSAIDQAKELLKKMEEQNRLASENLKRQEELVAENLLSGKSEAGGKAPEPSEDEKAKERINNILKNTGWKI